MHYVINKVVEKFPQITIDNYHEVSHYGRTILREENRYNAFGVSLFQSWLNGKLIEIKDIKTIKTSGKMEMWLKIVFNKIDFNNFTREELAYILNKLYPHMQKPYGKSMAKRRQIAHIKSWLLIHNKIDV